MALHAFLGRLKQLIKGGLVAQIPCLFNASMDWQYLEFLAHSKELQIIGSSDGWDYHHHARWYFHVVQRHWACLEQIFEVRIARDALIATFEQLAKGDIRPVKVFVSYGPVPSVSGEKAVLFET